MPLEVVAAEGKTDVGALLFNRDMGVGDGWLTLG
jgi:hypothetical protein